MVDYEYKDLFGKDSVDIQMQIVSSAGTITNSDLLIEDMTINEALCSEEELKFGSCEASGIEFTVLNNSNSLKNNVLDVKAIIDGKTDKPFRYGKYKVYSDTPSADRKYRTIKAYDSMFDIINADVKSWYDALTFPITIKDFRDAFFEHFNIEQVNKELIFDDLEFSKTIDAESISGKDILFDLCELNGCFGHINREGKMTYIYLQGADSGLYPSNSLYPSDNLFPKSSEYSEFKKSKYISCEYESFVTNNISQLVIRSNENDLGVTVGVGSNKYIIQENIFLLGKTESELTEIANKLFSVIKNVVYRPASLYCKGNPCIEVGDAIKVYTDSQIVSTFVFERELKGIKALFDSYSAKGVENYSGSVNSIASSFKALQGKTNELTRTLEETKSTITDLETELHGDYSTTTDMRSEITQSANSIRQEVSTTYTTQQQFNELQAQVDGNITTYEGDYEPTLSNEPASAWTTEEERQRHIGSLFIITKDNTEKAGYQYRFSKPSTGWEWTLLANSDVQKAIKDAQDALSLAGITAEDLSTNYSTTTQMNSAIEASKDSIELSVSETYSTKTEVSGYVDDIEEKFGDYSTTTEMNSAINVSKEGIEQSVSKTYQTISDMSNYATNGKVNTDIKSVESKISQTADSISLTVNNGSLGNNVGIKIAVTNPITGEVVEDDGNINLTGAVTFDDLSGAGRTTINGANITTGTINCDLLKGGTISGQTISGGSIYGTDIYAKILGFYDDVDGAASLRVMFEYDHGNAYVKGYAPTKYLSLQQFSAGAKFNEATIGSIGITGNIVSCAAGNLQLKNSEYTLGLYGSSFRVNGSYTNKVSLGSSSGYWTEVFAKKGTINTSDRNEKHDIQDVSEKYENMFNKLRPVSYMFNDGDRTHIGFISQEVEGAMSKSSITDMDFAGFCKDKKENENGYTYGIRYSEFIALNTHMIQKQQKEINELKSEIEELKNMIKALK